MPEHTVLAVEWFDPATGETITEQPDSRRIVRTSSSGHPSAEMLFCFWLILQGHR